ncbi:Fe-S cluster assembly protein SufD [Methylopila sp. M107]|uniref:Fe-S cluster assembly protein SufD n=1 Tax=Methylopila sp. M107 TaxID=1101190 RepID=UPI0004784B34|nr:Fe-S cluster assembly protein SufD [Methylopila sp. M107]
MNAEVRPIRTAAETALGEAYASVRADLPGGETARLVRDAAFANVERAGLPNRRVEDWKYTDLRALMRDIRPFPAAPVAADVEGARTLLSFGDVDAQRVVFVNGRLVPELSDVDGVEGGVSIAPLAVALAGDAASALALKGLPKNNVPTELNTAFVADGLVIAVADGVAAQRPIHVANIQTGEGHASYGRVLISIGRGGSLTFLESHVGEGGAHQTNTLVGVDLADEARLTLVKLQDENLATLHLATLAVRLGARSKLDTVTLSAGSAAARQQIQLDYAGDHAEANVTGAGFAGGRRHLDTTLVVDHATLHCSSRELFKTALDGEARSVFQGKIVVRPGAQKTDGKMMANALLLSEGAEADAKPELEIFADDVVCGHGATVGQLDDELLFYLKARGIPQAEAEALLVQAFVGEVLEAIEIDPLREALMARAERWLVERS